MWAEAAQPDAGRGGSHKAPPHCPSRSGQPEGEKEKATNSSSQAAFMMSRNAFLARVKFKCLKGPGR